LLYAHRESRAPPAGRGARVDADGVLTGVTGRDRIHEHAGRRRADGGRAEASRAETGRTDASRADAGRTDAGQADAGRAGTGRTKAGRADAPGNAPGSAPEADDVPDVTA
ncbi:hypothetical protein ACFXEZ_17205, partial [Streptomyces hygroscopicus]